MIIELLGYETAELCSHTVFSLLDIVIGKKYVGNFEEENSHNFYISNTLETILTPKVLII